MTVSPISEDARAEELLAEVVYSMTDVTGALLTSLDGRSIASDLPSWAGEKQTAAVAASAFGLGQRIVELGGSAPIEELVFRSADSTVVVYSIDGRGALVVLTKPTVNLALLHLKARTLVPLLVPALAAAPKENND